MAAHKRELQNELLSIRTEKDELESALVAERENRRSAEATLEEKEEELSAFLSTAQDMRQETRRQREEESMDQPEQWRNFANALHEASHEKLPESRQFRVCTES